MSQLFTPFKLRDVTFRNRIAVSPMCQYSSEDGFASDWHLVHLGSRAVGGAGLIIMEATAVTPQGRISYGDHGLWKDEHIAMLSRITAFIKEQGSVAGIQIAHAGRKASCETPWNGGEAIAPDAPNGWQVVAPSSIAFTKGDPVPHALSKEEISALTQSFVDAAKRALNAGFEVLELHAAHGYLMHEFLSPLSNTRTDEYGGSFENRTRFVLEVTDAVRKVWPQNLPLFVRISATDWVEGGWNEKESIELSKMLKTKGVDLIDCSSGALVPDAKIPTGPGYQVPFAEHVKKEVGIATGAVGMITTPDQAEKIIAEGQADIVLLARAELHDAYWPLHAQEALLGQAKPLKQYQYGFPPKR